MEFPNKGKKTITCGQKQKSVDESKKLRELGGCQPSKKGGGKVERGGSSDNGVEKIWNENLWTRKELEGNRRMKQVEE